MPMNVENRDPRDTCVTRPDPVAGLPAAPDAVCNPDPWYRHLATDPIRARIARGPPGCDMRGCKFCGFRLK